MCEGVRCWWCVSVGTILGTEFVLYFSLSKQYPHKHNYHLNKLSSALQDMDIVNYVNFMLTPISETISEMSLPPETLSPVSLGFLILW